MIKLFVFVVKIPKMDETQKKNARNTCDPEVDMAVSHTEEITSSKDDIQDVKLGK